MNYSQTHFCITCGSNILDDASALECAVCRGRSAQKNHVDEGVTRPIPVQSDDDSSSTKGNARRTWILAWFVFGAVWYLFDLAELSGEREDWLLYVEALRPVSYAEFGIKTLGIMIAGPLVVRRFIPAVTTFLSSLVKSIAIGVGIFVVIAIFMDSNVWPRLESAGKDAVQELFEYRDVDAIEPTSSPAQSELEPEDSIVSEPTAAIDPTALIEPTTVIEPQDLDSVTALRSYVLNMINVDRADHGIAPVVMGTNSAAQDHANDMLAFGYLGHWWVDGKKPYMAYSQAGGTSYVAENAAVAGHKIAGYIDNDCSGLFSLCEDLDPEEQLGVLQYAMVYDDADSNWGHRDTMLDDAHTEVSIGIAFSDDFISLVQHFSSNAARAIEGPSYSGNRLSMKVELLDPSTEVFESIAVWWEPLPIPRAPEDIGALRAYCVGGDFTAECGYPVASIFPPAPVGKYYPDLAPDEVVADEWALESGIFSFSVVLPQEVMKPGMFTVGVLEDVGGSTSDQVLVMLSTRWTE
jgi:hypothetical protein